MCDIFGEMTCHCHKDGETPYRRQCVFINRQIIAYS